MKIKVKEMKISRTRLGLAFLACALVIGAIGSASAGQAQDEAAVRALGDTFAKAFVQKNAELRASIFAENGTFVTPTGDYESSVNLGRWGNPDPYFVSLDLSTARHPQTLLATHLNGKPLTVEHGAPLRLLAPVKLGLKNIKAITRITYTGEEPADYWAKRGYSRYDGI